MINIKEDQDESTSVAWCVSEERYMRAIIFLLMQSWIIFDLIGIEKRIFDSCLDYTSRSTRRRPGKLNIACLTYWKTMVLWFSISYRSWMLQNALETLSHAVHLSFQRILGFFQVHACI